MTHPPNAPMTGPQAHLTLTVQIPKYVWISLAFAMVVGAWTALIVADEMVAQSAQRRALIRIRAQLVDAETAALNAAIDSVLRQP